MKDIEEALGSSGLEGATLMKHAFLSTKILLREDIFNELKHCMGRGKEIIIDSLGRGIA